MTFSQNTNYPQYPNPVKIPVYLSATFAELRSNAFHAGVDIKTQGVEGKEVFAVAAPCRFPGRCAGICRRWS